MNLQDKIEKGAEYLIKQTETKLKTLGSVEKGKFTPTDPHIYKKYKTNAEFRLRFVEAVQELMKEHILLSDGILEFISRIDKDGNVEEADLEGLKQFAEKYKVTQL